MTLPRCNNIKFSDIVYMIKTESLAKQHSVEKHRN